MKISFLGLYLVEELKAASDEMLKLQGNTELIEGLRNALGIQNSGAPALFDAVKKNPLTGSKITVDAKPLSMVEGDGGSVTFKEGTDENTVTRQLSMQRSKAQQVVKFKTIWMDLTKRLVEAGEEIQSIDPDKLPGVCEQNSKAQESYAEAMLYLCMVKFNLWEGESLEWLEKRETEAVLLRAEALVDGLKCYPCIESSKKISESEAATPEDGEELEPEEIKPLAHFDIEALTKALSLDTKPTWLPPYQTGAPASEVSQRMRLRRSIVFNNWALFILSLFISIIAVMYTNYVGKNFGSLWDYFYAFSVGTTATTLVTAFSGGLDRILGAVDV